MPLALHQSSVQRDFVQSLGTHCAFSPWKGLEKPSTSRCRHDPVFAPKRLAPMQRCFGQVHTEQGAFSRRALCLQVTRLRYTPRKFVVHPDHNTLIVAEADHAAVPAAERRATEDGMDTDGQQAEVQALAFLTYLFYTAVFLSEAGLQCLLPSESR